MTQVTMELPQGFGTVPQVGGVTYAGTPTTMYAGTPSTGVATYTGGSIAYAGAPVTTLVAGDTLGASYSQPITTAQYMGQPVTTMVAQPVTTMIASRPGAARQTVTKCAPGTIPPASSVKPMAPGVASVAPDGKFVDSEFPPNDTTLGVAKPGRSFIDATERAQCQWIRIPDLIQRNSKISGQPVYWQDIGCQDLTQGDVGDCWLVSSINVIGEFPELVARIFKRQGMARRPCPCPETGQHTVEFYDMAQAQFVDITVDDYVPCIEKEDWDDIPFHMNNMGQKVYSADAAAMYARNPKKKLVPFFGKSTSNEVWPLILEKAMAKFCGSYALVAGGQEVFALTAFTGMPQAFVLRRPSADASDEIAIPGAWDVCGAQYKQKHENAMQCDKLHQAQLGDQDLFDLVANFDSLGFLLCAHIGKYPAPVTIKDYFRPDGIVSGHAYSLIDVKAATDSMGQVVGFARLRNPHGKGDAGAGGAPTTEWNGNWCDGHPLWAANPGIAQQLNYVAVNDGTFWMEWGDFTAVYDEIAVVPRKVKDAQTTATSPVTLPVCLERILTLPRNQDLSDDFQRLASIGFQFCGQDGRPIIFPYDPYSRIPSFLLDTTQRTSPAGIEWLASKPGRLQELVDAAPEPWQKEYFLKKIREHPKGDHSGALGPYGHIP